MTTRSALRAPAAVALAVTVGAGSVAFAQTKAPAALSIAQRVVIDSPYAIMADDAEAAFVESTAQKAIAANCTRCHGADLKGKPGVPDLTDYDFLWGITLEDTNDVAPVRELEQTILYGVRNEDCPPAVYRLSAYADCPDTRYSEMPAYGDMGVLTQDQIHDVVEYVLTLSGQAADAAAAARGRTNFAICTECHGPEGKGYKVFGGPNLTDDVWLYGGDRKTLTETLTHGREGECPAWVYKLDAATIKSIAMYLWEHEH